MKVSETRKPNKYVALVTYLIAIVCLLLGLFLPLFNGNEILALRLPGVLNNMAGKALISSAAEFTPIYNVNLFGLGLYVDFMAYALFLYVIVTLSGLLALIPIGFSFRKDTGAGFAFERIIATAAALILSLYMALALNLYPEFSVSYNMLIAFGGSVIALILLTFNAKGGAAFIKAVLFILSLIALFLLFDVTAVIPELKEPLDSLGESSLLYPAIFNNSNINISGIRYVYYLFGASDGTTLSQILAGSTLAAHKAAIAVTAIAGTLVIINYAIDVLCFNTNAGTKKFGLIFHIARYGVELLSLVILLIVVPIAHLNIGLFLIVIAALAFIQTLISVLRFVSAIRKARDAKSEEDFASQTIRFAKPAKQPRPRPEDRPHRVKDIPAFEGAEPIVPEPIVADTIETPEPQAEQMAFIDPAPEAVEEQPEEAQPLTEHPGEVQLEIEEAKSAEEPVEEQPEEIPEPEEQYAEPDDTLFGAFEDEPVEEQSEEPEEVEPVEEIQPEEAEPVEKQPEEAALTAEEAVEPVTFVQPEPVAEPLPEEPEPVEKQPEEAQPEEPLPEPVKPVIPVVIEPIHEVRTAQVVQKPYIDRRIYREMYEQTDSFMDKLTESEKQEFTRTFIEKNNGDIGNIPEYIVGGNNKKFFSAVFIYLGRVRGLISDGLLNKMFKELNMM